MATFPEVGLIPTRQTSMGGALASLVASANCVHLPVGDLGWGNFLWIFALFWCGSLELLGWSRLAGDIPWGLHR